ncbi:hypothetical protein NCLIV_016480 [Neospora caninum Liverpool]|uniref:Phosphate transporter n=1 Tax=Neospora caninum (strain Liverpool) TaxID=572307 RepID=F0VDR3_NEOCL|nr:hypothetical protein NCLIV_016480 [Neospora caninum Liverpool]CBZ51856.1 hypothetical protein NCLIV_016480 [Neospora caninum Liverpool]CEL65813.1 TPA: Sodium-dependent phosphate transporter 1 [Neospora caninum Liverpool]|eukprot:XP_003881889.1 hypothetical protein NCLIV_016480 [Neospora caninum Liverpool]
MAAAAPNAAASALESLAQASPASLAGTPSDFTWIVAVAGITCFLTAFAIGANDVANTFSSSVGSRAIPLWAAIAMSAVLETVGATLLGGAVTDSIRSKIIDFEVFRETPSILMTGMLCALIGAGLWLFLANHLGLPVSTTHSIIGALLGFGLASGNVSAVKWSQVAFIVGSWIAAPLAASVVGASIFVCMRRLILRSRQPLRRAKRFLWIFIWLITLTFSVFLVFKNFFEIDTSCEQMMPSGEVERFSPCRISRWADAHAGPSVGIALGLSVVLTAVISCLVYRFAFYRVQSYRRRQQEKKGSCDDRGSGPAGEERPWLGRGRSAGLLATPRSFASKPDEAKSQVERDDRQRPSELDQTQRSMDPRHAPTSPHDLPFEECMDTRADSVHTADGARSGLASNGTELHEIRHPLRGDAKRETCDEAGSPLPERSLLNFSRALAQQDAHAFFQNSPEHTAPPLLSSSSLLQFSPVSAPRAIQSVPRYQRAASDSLSLSPASASPSPFFRASSPESPRACASPAHMSPCLPRVFFSTAAHALPQRELLSDTDADTPDGPLHRRRPGGDGPAGPAKGAERAPRDPKGEGEADSLSQFVIVAAQSPETEQDDEGVSGGKRVEGDSRITLKVPPHEARDGHEESFFAPTLTHDDNGLLFIPGAEIGASVTSELGDEEEPPKTWKGKLRAAWRNMPWFKDIHAEGSTEDELVAQLQTGAEVFDTETELFFSACQVVSACMGCIAHSANDTANAIGPFAAILTVYQTGVADSEIGSPWYILLFGGLSMSLGLALLGYRVIKTVGVKLVKITPARGFSMELGAAWTVLIFSAVGVPLSTTHCAVGSTVGVGLMEPRNPRSAETGDGPACDEAEGSKRSARCPFVNTASVNWKLFGGVFVSWIVTIAFSALVTAALFSFAAYSPRMVSQ